MARVSWRWALGALCVLVCGAVLSYPWWLAALGRALVLDEVPERADIAVVLGGDYSGSRLLKGAQLVRDGFVPAVLVSGPGAFYGSHEDDYAIAYAVKLGYPRNWFIGVPHGAMSTAEESIVIVSELQRRGVRRYLLVTSNFHTARAGRVFAAAQRKLGATMEMRVVAAPDRYFQLPAWWSNREGRKTFFFEWSKTVASAIGL